MDEINVSVNDLLQLKLGHAISDAGRFLLNSMVGLGGFLDIASSVGLDKNEEDFGQTPAFWGVGAGPYLVLPVFGASNVRDTFGLVLDTVFHPIQYYRESALRYPLLLLE